MSEEVHLISPSKLFRWKMVVLESSCSKLCLVCFAKQISLEKRLIFAVDFNKNMVHRVLVKVGKWVLWESGYCSIWCGEEKRHNDSLQTLTNYVVLAVLLAN